MRFWPRVFPSLMAFAVLLSLVVAIPAEAAKQNDAGTKRDAGNTFGKATAVKPYGYYAGTLDTARGDLHDFYRFHLREGRSMSVLIEIGSDTTDPITLLDPNGNIVDVGTKIEGVGLTVSSVLTNESMPPFVGAPRRWPFSAIRLSVDRALSSGYYRLHIENDRFAIGDYNLCFQNCEQPRSAPQDLIFGGSLPTTSTKVLLVPPSHGDLGNPVGPSVLDYINATLRGIRRWEKAFNAFAKDYPEYSYLRKIDIHIEVFDGLHPVDPVGYDVILVYAHAGPQFRGLASDQDETFFDEVLREAGLEDTARFTGRLIFLSLFGSSPRVGQVTYDFPEVTDLEMVTMHEFGHTFGLGHTLTWDAKRGPDLMNSPATFFYGDGSAVGDGGQHTKMDCLSSLNLYGLAVLYRWIPSGQWRGSEGRVKLPEGMPYKWYC